MTTEISMGTTPASFPTPFISMRSEMNVGKHRTVGLRRDSFQSWEVALLHMDQLDQKGPRKALPVPRELWVGGFGGTMIQTNTSQLLAINLDQSTNKEAYGIPSFPELFTGMEPLRINMWCGRSNANLRGRGDAEHVEYRRTGDGDACVVARSGCVPDSRRRDEKDVERWFALGILGSSPQALCTGHIMCEPVESRIPCLRQARSVKLACRETFDPVLSQRDVYRQIAIVRMVNVSHAQESRVEYAFGLLVCKDGWRTWRLRNLFGSPGKIFGFHCSAVSMADANFGNWPINANEGLQATERDFDDEERDDPWYPGA
ncbi:hypothetical protein IW261DRAFT_1424086 [Armillaria novae-zelandiae]|uniref:Uncharacterized protein n=1 Tax=Armillaria novae-zelandiae TaxID=153914 RepID=A0AA39NWJ7_9AGAR|nr:hypothetical protein IW261DRAFT_1424086 [Armillaria novae-zelandiae]